MRDGSLTRRGLLAVGGVLAVKAADGMTVKRSGDSAAPVEPRDAVPGASLTDERRRTYVALVEAVAASPGTLADASRADEVADELARRYEDGAPLLRGKIGEALTAVDDDERFASLGVAERLDRLRRGLLANTPVGEDGRTPADTVRDAICLAAAPFDPGDFRWDPDVAEIWVRTMRAAGAPGPRA